MSRVPELVVPLPSQRQTPSFHRRTKVIIVRSMQKLETISGWMAKPPCGRFNRY